LMLWLELRAWLGSTYVGATSALLDPLHVSAGYLDPAIAGEGALECGVELVDPTVHWLTRVTVLSSAGLATSTVPLSAVGMRGGMGARKRVSGARSGHRWRAGPRRMLPPRAEDNGRGPSAGAQNDERTTVNTDGRAGTSGWRTAGTMMECGRCNSYAKLAALEHSKLC